MENIKIEKKRTYKPQSIKDSLKNVNKKFLYKFGKLDFIVHSKWPEIVGVFFANHSEPLKINSVNVRLDETSKKIFENTLYVNVTPAAAIEFEHFKDKIIEKINSYFGYIAIKNIRIHQNFKKKQTYTKNLDESGTSKKIKNKIDIKKNISNINNKELEESIVNLGLSISNKKD